MRRREWQLPGPPEDNLVIWFPCKWCGDRMSVKKGRLQEHSCPVPHSVDEHIAYAKEQIEALGERQIG